ncbi:PorV/PorQ family protein [candidate division KSB1 bacterium]|nr:PorV/PorQ family protein [candidate division KSB1 bacterium]
MKKKFILIIMIIPMFAYAYERPGSSTGQFLNIGVSPRGVAMGDAFVSETRGAEAVYYNAAAMARIKGTSFTANHTDWFAGMNLDFLGLTRQIGRDDFLGFSATSFYTDQMKVRTPLQPDGTGETFSVSHLKFGISYARLLTNHVSFGATISYLHLKLFTDMEEHAVTADIAALYDTNYRGFSFGLAISNFGSSVTYVNKDYPMPLNFSFGLGANAIEREDQKLKISFAAIKPSGGETKLNAGMEWDYKHNVFLRGGYRFNHALATYSAGFGVCLEISKVQCQLDYSISEYSQFGFVNRFGLSLKY